VRTWAHGVLSQTTPLAPLPAVVGNAAYPIGQRAGIVQCDGNAEGAQQGPFSACDVAIAAPAAWNDVTFVLRARLGTAWTELDVRTVADVERAIWVSEGANVGSAGRVSGILFSYRGDYFDEFAVEAWPTSNDHDPATFTMRLWRHESENVVEPFAPLSDTIEGVSNVVPPLALTTVIPAPASGRRIFLTELSITHSDPTPPVRCILFEVTAGGTNIVRRNYQVGASGVFPSFVKPIDFQPGSAAAWTAALAAGSATINLGGFTR
jgi:hypothetical protein